MSQYVLKPKDNRRKSPKSGCPDKGLLRAQGPTKGQSIAFQLKSIGTAVKTPALNQKALKSRENPIINCPGMTTIPLLPPRDIDIP